MEELYDDPGVYSTLGNNLSGGLNNPGLLGIQMAEAKSWAAIERVQKALTVGDGVVGASDTGGKAARLEFIHGSLSNESWQEERAVTFNRLSKEKIRNTAVQWLRQTDLGFGGDGLSPENGILGDFESQENNDADFRRQVENIGIITDVRSVGIIADMVDTQVLIPENAKKNALAVLKMKANRVTLFGNRDTNALSPNGLLAQMIHGVQANTPDGKGVCLDAGGYAVDPDVLSAVAMIANEKFARLNVMLSGGAAYEGLQHSVKAMQRSGQFMSGALGISPESWDDPYNNRKIPFVVDPNFRGNNPVRHAGRGANGQARDANTVDSGALTIASTPFTSVAAGAAGTRFYLDNYTKQTDAVAPATAPNYPRGTDQSSNSNRLAAGTYYYGVSFVYMGRESLLSVNGTAAGTPGTLGTPTGTVVTAGQVVKLTILTSGVTGLGSTYRYDRVTVRIYRADALPTTIQDFKYLGETGIAQDGSCAFWDNGVKMPGTHDVLFLSETDSDGKLVFWAQLAETFARPLPNNMLADNHGFIMMGTPILKKPLRHIWVRNVTNVIRGSVFYS